MALAHLKNKITGELHKVERGSQEYLDKAAERDDNGRTLFEDRGVAGHAEEGVEPAVGNINDRNYNDPDVFPEAPREEEEDQREPDTVLDGQDRETHAMMQSEHEAREASGEGSSTATEQSGGKDATDAQKKTAADEAQRKSAQAQAESEAESKKSTAS